MYSFKQLDKLNPENKTVIITGANSGLGFEVARYFALSKANVLLCSRSLDKGETAKAKITQQFPDAKVDVLRLDLADRASIEAFVEVMKAKQTTIDFLINNAGIMATPYALTKDGFESQIGVNHLGHFILTAHLLPLLNNDARIVNVSSMAYLQGTMDKHNFMFEKGGYRPFKSYARSKLANLLFTYALANRLENHQKNIVVVAAHPGVAMTGLFDRKESTVTKFLKVFSPLLATAEMGAKPILTAALDKMAKPKNFYGPYKSKTYHGDKIILEKPNKTALNIQNQEDCWNLSLSITNIIFPI